MLDDLWMNIYALKGHKVKCISLESPYHYQTERAQKHLEIGKEYTVESTEVRSSSTNVVLLEFPKIEFNSTLFEDVIKQSEEEDQKHPDYWKYHKKQEPMKILSTNIGEKREIDWKGKKVTTGIFKYPIEEPIFLVTESVKNVAICDRKYHGGIDQAVYAYSYEHYSHFIRLFPKSDWKLGMFGENLTMNELDETQLHVGDTFQVGECVLEVTKPREPCMKLGVRFDNVKVVKEFWNTSYSGVYFKIIKTGFVKAGDEFIPLETFPENKTIAELYEEKK